MANAAHYLLRDTQKNPVTAYLKQNGYDIHFFFPSDYLVKEKHVDNISFYNRQHNPKNYETFAAFMTDLQAHLDTFFSTRSPASPPLFLLAKIGGITEEKSYTGGVKHIPNHLRNTGQSEKLPALRQTYLQEIQEENIHLKRLIQNILKKDKEALIVLTGDHGPFFHEIHVHEDIKTLSEEEKVLDFFNVLGAVKWPETLTNDDSDTASTLSHANLFRIIFSVLSQEKLMPQTMRSNLALDTYNGLYNLDNNRKEKK